MYYYEPNDPVVQTKYGKLRGFTFGDVNHFLGIKYADAKRFEMPTEVKSWEGVKDVKTYGPVMLQMHPFRPKSSIEGMNNPWAESEDCQYLNIWAPKHDDNKKRPVFVYMHGGGFFSGSSMESDCFDGFNMAHEGDVLMVTMNHRLNLLGYLNLADYGNEYKNTVNVGIADLVICLKWIHENIEAFGGDPGNVTIAGHSGGGGKVLCMYQIEEARNYFSRGYVISGTLDDGPETNDKDSRILAKAILDKLGITKENIEKLKTVPYHDITAAYFSVVKELMNKGVCIGMSPVENDYFAGFPVLFDFTDYALEKPLLISTTLGEFNFKINIPEDVKKNLSEEDKLVMIKDRYKDGADELLKEFKKTYPDHDIIDLMYLDSAFRRPALEAAYKKARKSPNENTYLAMFTYNFPVEERITPWHGSDLPYIFFNAQKAPVCNEAVYGEKLSAAYKAMMLSYIRTGNPNNECMPEWKSCTKDRYYTMVIDKEINLREDHDKELIKLHTKYCPVFDFRPETF